MNIFATSECPVQSALWLDDKRVPKMILETAQMVSTAVARWTCVQGESVDGLYKPAYKNHPCTRWAGNNRSNFLWLVDHGLALSSVYELCFSNKHKSTSIIQLAYEYASCIPLGDQESFADCTEFKSLDAPVIERYRQFMILKWVERDTTKPTWRKRQQPEWYQPCQ